MLIETMRHFPSLSLMNITSFSRHSPGDENRIRYHRTAVCLHTVRPPGPHSQHIWSLLWAPVQPGPLVPPGGVASPSPGCSCMCSNLLWRPLKGPQGSKRFVSTCSHCQAGGQAAHDILVIASSDSRRKEIKGAIFKGQNQSRVSRESWRLS